MQKFENLTKLNLDGPIRRVHAGVASTDIEAGKQVIITISRPMQVKQTEVISKPQSEKLRRVLAAQGWKVTEGIHPGTYWSARPGKTVN